MAQTNAVLKVGYLHLTLANPSLDEETRSSLERLGLECIEEGDYYEAYAIGPLSTAFFGRLRALEGVVQVERRDPPCGM